MLRCKRGGPRPPCRTRKLAGTQHAAALSPVKTLAISHRGYVILENGALVPAGRANELTDNLSLKRFRLVGAHCWAFQAARMSAPVADHTPPWLWMRSSTSSIAAMRCGTPLIQGLRDSATMRPPLLAASR